MEDVGAHDSRRDDGYTQIRNGTSSAPLPTDGNPTSAPTIAPATIVPRPSSAARRRSGSDC
jgi:hypothetical protein